MHEHARSRHVNSPLLVNTKGSSSESRDTPGCAIINENCVACGSTNAPLFIGEGNVFFFFFLIGAENYSNLTA